MASSRLMMKVLFMLFSIQAVAFATRYQSYGSCDPPRHPDNGGYYGSTYRRLKYPIGSKIRFFCKNGYELEGASWTICKYFNRRVHWLHSPPVCRRKFNTGS